MPRFLCLLIVVAIVPIAAQTKRALTIEDYYRIQTVQSPSISPDGRWVTFTVATRMEEDNRTTTETWVVPSDASAQPSRVRHYGRDVAGAGARTTNVATMVSTLGFPMLPSYRRVDP